MIKLFIVFLTICISSSSCLAIQLSDQLLARGSDLGIDLSFTKASFEDSDVTLSTNQLDFLLNELKVVGKGSNQVVSKFGSIQSKAIAVDYDALEIQFLGDVFLSHKDIKLNSDEAYVKVNENTFIAKQSVTFSFGDYKSQSDIAKYDRELNQIQFEGNVLFSHADEYAKGDVIIFDLNKETFLSKGSAKVKISRDVIQ